MDRGRIFIANLSKGHLGDGTTNLLGSFLVTQFHLAAMSRVNVPEEKRRDFVLYVDEWHLFASESFASALAECRKYRLGLVLANQHLAQLRPTLRDAVFGNAGSTLAFRVGYEDAIALEKTFGSAYTAEQFTSLSNGEAYAKLLSNGVEREPFLLRTTPPVDVRKSRKETILKRSREKYSHKRLKAEARIKRWLTKRN
jgi:hypothetical protein